MNAVLHALRVAGFCLAVAYFASFPLVGWHFLLPGRFTFGVVCCFGLAALGTRAVATVPSASMRALVTFLFVYVVLIVSIAMALDAGIVDAKDYFIVGLPLSAIIAVAAAISFWRHRSQSAITWPAAAKIGGLWLVLLAVYFALQLLSNRVELLRFVRIQWVMLAIVAVVGVIFAAILRRSDRKNALS